MSCAAAPRRLKSGQVNQHSGDEVTLIFDRKLLRQRRQRAARTIDNADFLVGEIAVRLAERLGEINRRFDTVLQLGAGNRSLTNLLGNGSKVGLHLACDSAQSMIVNQPGPGLVADEEFLPFGPNSLDAVLSLFTLHWVNDLPGCLAQIRYALKPGGAMLAALAGGDTLYELRWTLTQAELETTGGAGPRIAPFVDIREGAALLQRAGFDLPMADIDRITVNYRDPRRLLEDLRSMGETNVLRDRPRTILSRSTVARAIELYQSEFGNEDGLVPATFDVIFLTGWKKQSETNRSKTAVPTTAG